MSTREIRTSVAQAACDVCGRTLLRGERAEIYLSGGNRHSVCELCTSRALHGGWVREGEMPEYDASRSRTDRRRSLLGRWRGRREGGPAPSAVPEFDEPPAFEDELLMDPVDPPPAPEAAPPRPAPRARPARGPAPSPSGREGGPVRPRSLSVPGREPRHVRAVPTSVENKVSSAVSLFNESEHPRTVAGIARSLGLPDVAVHPADANGSIMQLVISWELCWYRYEVDLSDEVPQVRSTEQGYELSELAEIDRRNNAVADDRGRLALSH